MCSLLSHKHTHVTVKKMKENFNAQKKNFKKKIRLKFTNNPLQVNEQTGQNTSFTKQRKSI